MTGATFHGMRAWRLDGGIIDCEDTALGYVDLHNECDFLELRVVAGENVSVRLLFRHLPTGRAFELSFAAVSGLEVEQLDNVPEDAHLFHDLSHVPEDTLSAIEVELAAARLVFRCARVEFVEG
ncbi:hypothetical protein [Lentzea sp. NPDC003310]|uniref:hypothetical protein n=1 Tax=Lentzea sp. NPDC003310 TaxID=3154447 RepID=UPI0033BDFFAF